jgi:AcrR family transcriptional regulator
VPRPRTVSDQQVLAAVTRVAGRVGPAGLTLAAVAREAGIAPATLIQRFGSRRAMLLQAQRHAAEAVRRSLDRGARRESGTLEQLVDNLVALADPVADPIAFSNHLALLHQDLSDPEFHACAQSHARTMRDAIERTLRRARDRGELASVPVEQLAWTLLTTYNGALLTWAVERDGALVDWLRRELEAVLSPWRQPVWRPARQRG